MKLFISYFIVVQLLSGQFSVSQATTQPVSNGRIPHEVLQKLSELEKEAGKYPDPVRAEFQKFSEGMLKDAEEILQGLEENTKEKLLVELRKKSINTKDVQVENAKQLTDKIKETISLIEESKTLDGATATALDELLNMDEGLKTFYNELKAKQKDKEDELKQELLGVLDEEKGKLQKMAQEIKSLASRSVTATSMTPIISILLLGRIRGH